MRWYNFVLLLDKKIVDHCSILWLWCVGRAVILAESIFADTYWWYHYIILQKLLCCALVPEYRSICSLLGCRHYVGAKKVELCSQNPQQTQKSTLEAFIPMVQSAGH